MILLFVPFSLGYAWIGARNAPDRWASISAKVLSTVQFLGLIGVFVFAVLNN